MMRSVQLSFFLLLFPVLVFAQSKETQRQKDSLEIVTELNKLIGQRQQLSAKLAELKISVSYNDSLVENLKNKNQATKRYSDSLKVQLEENQKAGGNSKQYKRLLKEWARVNADIEKNIRDTNKIDEDRKGVFADMQRAEKLIDQLEKGIQELRKLIYP